MFCVWLAGGRPQWLDPQTDPACVAELDGLVITGGSDIDPTAYGSSDKPWSPPDVERDLFELAVLKEAERRSLPLLGICRGSQLLNVARGGNLFADIAALRQRSRNYRTLLPRRFVRLEQNSRLRRLFPHANVKVNALHHQAVRNLGRELRVVGCDIDDVVQAIEDPGQRFAIGVQWHPEYLFWWRPHQALFRGLLQAARDRQRD